MTKMRMTRLTLIAAALTAMAGAAEESVAGGVDRDGAAPVQQPGFVEVGSRRVARTASARIPVIDVFWYSCPHCFALESEVLKWQAQQRRDVEFSRLPAVWDEPTRSDAQLFYTIRHLGRDDLHQAIYDEIHVHGNSLKARTAGETLTMRVMFAKEHGIPAERFTRTYESAAVRLDVERARQLSERWKLTRTPAFVVDDDFETDPARVGALARLLPQVDQLVARARASRHPGAQVDQ